MITNLELCTLATILFLSGHFFWVHARLDKLAELLQEERNRSKEDEKYKKLLDSNVCFSKKP